MRILFVQPVAPMSIGDVGRGYSAALTRAGHEVVEYSMSNRTRYHVEAIKAYAPARITGMPHQALIARNASETIVVEALCNEVDHVVIVSGLNVHPISLWLLGKVGIPASVILTESPYEDQYQAEWASEVIKAGGNLDLTIFTNDRYSAESYDWNLLAPAFDPANHHPADPVPEHECDVTIIGTGWPERQKFLEAVDWTGVNLRLLGIWPGLENPESPLARFYRMGVVDNMRIAEMYSSAKICLNFNRVSDKALTPGPRAFEIAACGAFQLSDPRTDAVTLFGDSVPIFTTPTELQRMVRYYLDRPEERTRMAADALRKVQGETFDHRAADLVEAISKRQQPGSLRLISQGA